METKIITMEIKTAPVLTGLGTIIKLFIKTKASTLPHSTLLTIYKNNSMKETQTYKLGKVKTIIPY